MGMDAIAKKFYGYAIDVNNEDYEELLSRFAVDDDYNGAESVIDQKLAELGLKKFFVCDNCTLAIAISESVAICFEACLEEISLVLPTFEDIEKLNKGLELLGLTADDQPKMYLAADYG